MGYQDKRLIKAKDIVQVELAGDHFCKIGFVLGTEYDNVTDINYCDVQFAYDCAYYEKEVNYFSVEIKDKHLRIRQQKRFNQTDLKLIQAD